MAFFNSIGSRLLKLPAYKVGLALSASGRGNASREDAVDLTTGG
ncbi:MAG: hypothetical protein ACLP9S_08465 [Syntrophales bacterium]|jgi:hypothetical protein